MRGLVIGIAGPSASGKSTLAREIARGIGAKMLCLDDYFIKEAARPVVNGFPSFERPEQYDGARLAADAGELRHSCHVVIEGFLLFRYPEALAICHPKLFVDLPPGEILRRRLKRDEGDGRKAKIVEAAFLANGALEWKAHGASQRDASGVSLLDGMRPRDELKEAALRLVGIAAGHFAA